MGKVWWKALIFSRARPGLTPVLLLLIECFVAAIFHNPCVKTSCITSKCVSPHHSPSVSFVVFRSTCHLPRVVHKNIKHSRCVGPIWVLPWWLHALKFSHKVRRVSPRYNRLLIVSICLQRCWWVWGLHWDMSKEWLRPYQALLSYKSTGWQILFYSLKKYEFWLHGRSFYTTENTFQPPTHTATFIPFLSSSAFHVSATFVFLMVRCVFSSPAYSFSNLLNRGAPYLLRYTTGAYFSSFPLLCYQRGCEPTTVLKWLQNHPLISMWMLSNSISLVFLLWFHV